MEVKKENAMINSNNLGSLYKFASSKLSNHRGNDLDKANLLNKYFSSVRTLDDGLTPDVVPTVSPNDVSDTYHSLQSFFLQRS